MDIADQLRSLAAAGYEVGLHGIDAWCDSAEGRAEGDELRRAAGVEEVGVRMHWLYFEEHSPETLERAGFGYDSTVGYNETVGYRAGTAQVYKPLEAERLMELPLHVMDTALFYPTYLNLSFRQARERVGTILDYAEEMGGCVTVNWHDRSIAPERLWGDFYEELVAEMEARGTWFATARQAVAWFRMRRAAEFTVDAQSGEIGIRVPDGDWDHLPKLPLYLYGETERRHRTGAGASNC